MGEEGTVRFERDEDVREVKMERDRVRCLLSIPICKLVVVEMARR